MSCSSNRNNNPIPPALAESSQRAIESCRDLFLKYKTGEISYTEAIKSVKDSMNQDPKEILKALKMDVYFTPEGSNIFIGAALIAIGLTLAFLGRRIFKLFLTISGLIVGASSAMYLIFYIETNFASNDDPAPAYIFWAASFIGGIFGAYLFNTAWRWGIYLMSAYGGYMLAVWVLGMIPQQYLQHINNLVVLILFSVAGGIAAHYVDELVVISASSLMGSFTAVFGFDFIYPSGFRDYVKNIVSNTELGLNQLIADAMAQDKINYCLLGVMFLTVVGIYIQYRHQPRSYDRD